MDLGDLITPESVLSSLKVKNKSRLFWEIASHASGVLKLDVHILNDALEQREKLGSTGLGNGIAIPHCKIAGINQIYGFFAHLSQPIDFDAMDEELVDLVFVLFAPESAGADHLKSLARISRLLRDPVRVRELRGEYDASATYSLLTEPLAAA